jgi:UMF1 family MFS transporter
MAAVSRRIWGWMAFDWASQPFYTLGLTFIFGYFAAVAAEYYLSSGLDIMHRTHARGIWSGGQTVAGLIIAFFRAVSWGLC